MGPDHASTDSGDDRVGTGPRAAPKRRRRIALLAGAAATVTVVAGAVVALLWGSSDVPAGWEARSYQGMTFAVPPGARTADEIVQGDEPSYTWNGPDLGRPGAFAHVTILVRSHGGDIPQDVDADVTVPGAVAVRIGVGPAVVETPESDGEFGATTGGFQIFTADAVALVFVQFPPGSVGERMADDLIASIDVTELDPE